MTDSTNKPACVIVGLDEVMADAPMPLIDIRAAQPDDDILISWQVEMDVKGAAKNAIMSVSGLAGQRIVWKRFRQSPSKFASRNTALFLAISMCLAMGLTDLQFLLRRHLMARCLLTGWSMKLLSPAAIESAVISWASA